MTPRTSSRRAGVRALVVAAATTATLGLGACAALQDPSAAALLDGEVVVTQAEVAEVVRTFPTELSGGEPPPPSQIILRLALEGPVRDLAVETGTPVTDPQEMGRVLQEQLPDGPAAYPDVVLRTLATDVMISSIAQGGDGALVEQLVADAGDRLELNPRYGTAVTGDPAQPFALVEHPWLSPAEDPEA